MRPLLLLFALQSFAATPDEYFSSIRANDLTKLRQLIASAAPDKADLDKAGRQGTTPLHYAAANGSLQAMQMLLDAGAPVNAKNLWGGTPLLLGAGSPEKILLLLAKGADPNLASVMGRTPLLIAAGRYGATDAVKKLLDAGADLHATDVRGNTALLEATLYGSRGTSELLLARGAKPDQADKAGNTPLANAVAQNDLQLVQLLLAKGCNPNAFNVFNGTVKKGPIALTKVTPLILAAAHSSPEIVQALVDSGANVNAQDNRGVTPLIAAVAAERQDIRVINSLLNAKADVNALDKQTGRSVLDWARRFHYPATLQALQSRGAKSAGDSPMSPLRSTGLATNSPRKAVDQAMELLTKSSTQFFNESGCVGCHHQSILSRAANSLRVAGVGEYKMVNEELTRGMIAANPLESQWLQFLNTGGDVDALVNALVGFGAAKLPASPLTDSAVNYIAGRQHSNGSWVMDGVSRAPLEESTITRTSLAIRAMQLYGWPARKAEFDERIVRASKWLLEQQPQTNYERADHLMGLHWAGAPSADISRAAKTLLQAQGADGGWSQNPYLASDAYATGIVLSALRESGKLEASKAPYKKGVAYLLRTQLDDGSWYVTSRAPKFQPYFESGFPHGHDQWISASATAWAVMALAPVARF